MACGLDQEFLDAKTQELRRDRVQRCEPLAGAAGVAKCALEVPKLHHDLEAAGLAGGANSLHHTGVDEVAQHGFGDEL